MATVVSRVAPNVGRRRRPSVRPAVGRLVLRELPTALGPMTAIALVRHESADLALDLGLDSGLRAGAAGPPPTESICLLEFSDRRMLPTQLTRIRGRFRAEPEAEEPGGRVSVLDRLQAELDAYFAGRLRSFGVPLAADGTPFQETAWAWLCRIPYGETRTYVEGAMGVGRPSAVRAFARANGDNRLAIVVPCHRIIGSDGDLTGYGGGLWRKRALLDLEAAAAR